MPAIDLRNRSAVTAEAGSEFASWALLSTDGVTLDGTPKTFTIIKESEYSYSQDLPEEEAEGGNTYALQGGKITATLKLTLLQQDKASQDFYKDYAGRRIVLVKEERRFKIAGKSQARIYPCLAIIPKYTRKLKGSTFDVEFKVESSAGLMTLDLTTFSMGFYNPLTCTSLEIPANTYDYLYEE